MNSDFLKYLLLTFVSIQMHTGTAKGGFGTFASVSPNASFGAPQGNSLFESLGASNNTMTFSNLAQNQNTSPTPKPFSGGYVQKIRSFFIIIPRYLSSSLYFCISAHHFPIGGNVAAQHLDV